MSADRIGSGVFIKRGFYQMDNLNELLGKVYHNLKTNELRDVDRDFVELSHYVDANVTLMYGSMPRTAGVVRFRDGRFFVDPI